MEEDKLTKENEKLKAKVKSLENRIVGITNKDNPLKEYNAVRVKWEQFNQDGDDSPYFSQECFVPSFVAQNLSLNLGFKWRDEVKCSHKEHEHYIKTRDQFAYPEPIVIIKEKIRSAISDAIKNGMYELGSNLKTVLDNLGDT